MRIWTRLSAQRLRDSLRDVTAIHPETPSGMVFLRGRVSRGFVRRLLLVLCGWAPLATGLAIWKAHCAKVRELAALVCAAALVEAEAQRLVAVSCEQVGRLI